MSTALATIQPQTLTTATALDAYTPRDFDQVMRIAGVLGKAANLTPEIAALKMAAGAAYGIDPVTALRLIDVIDGPNNTRQPSMRAQLMVAQCLRATDVCEYFESVESSATAATWAAKRKGRPERRMTFTIEDAQRAKLIKPGGAYEKDPESQLNARASSRLARLVFADVINGMYSAEELRDGDGGAEENARDVTPSTVQPLPAATKPAPVVVDAVIEESHDARAERLERELGAATTEAERAAIMERETAKPVPPARMPKGPARDRIAAANTAAKARIAAAATAALVAEEPATREPGEEG